MQPFMTMVVRQKRGIVRIISLIAYYSYRLFVPQAPQSSLYRRAESEIRLAIPDVRTNANVLEAKMRLRNGD